MTVPNTEAETVPNSLAREETSSIPAELITVVDQARAYMAKSKASNTIRAYRADYQHYQTWCEDHGLAPIPATNEQVALYLTAMATAGATASTMRRRISALSAANRTAGHDPVSTRIEPLHSVWAGILRVHGSAQEGVAPIRTEELRLLVAQLPKTKKGIRDRALLLLGFAGALRRSELVGLDHQDLNFNRDGLTITLRSSKTDQVGQGEQLGIPYGSHPETCPVRAVQDWLQESGITEGPVFRGVDRHGRMAAMRLSGNAVALVVKEYAAAAKLDPEEFAGHSLRAGLITTAAENGVQERTIAKQSRHKSLEVLRRYIREGSLFRENAASSVGL